MALNLLRSATLPASRPRGISQSASRSPQPAEPLLPQHTRTDARRSGHIDRSSLAASSAADPTQQSKRISHAVSSRQNLVPHGPNVKVLPPKSDYGEESSKIWSVYLSESEKQDKALVESWKGDMDGILIFAGLFSAVVTILLVEGLPLLQPDPEQLSATVLLRISLQLDGIADGIKPNLPSLPSLTSSSDVPGSSPLRLNVLWCLSLFLSLLSALCATLIQQWARDYMQAVERRSAPLQRARIRSFLSHGIEVSNAKAVVDGIPTILHLAVFLFLAGMYDFVLPSSRAIAWLVVAILCVYAGLYFSLSLVPLVIIGSPFRTPLSALLWRIKQLLAPLSYTTVQGERVTVELKNNISQGREEFAMHADSETKARDVEALSWTLTSLTEHDELEAFIEGVPDFMKSKRVRATDIMQELLEKSGFGLRISHLLETCTDPLGLSMAHRRRRVLAGFGALIALAKQWTSKENAPHWSACLGSPILKTVQSLIASSSQTKDIVVNLPGRCVAALIQRKIFDDYSNLSTRACTAIEDQASFLDENTAKLNLSSWAASVQEIFTDLSTPDQNQTGTQEGERVVWAKEKLELSNLVASWNTQCADAHWTAWQTSPSTPPAYTLRNGKLGTFQTISRYAALHVKRLVMAITLRERSESLNEVDEDKLNECLELWRPRYGNELAQKMVLSAQVANLIQFVAGIFAEVSRLGTSERTLIVDTVRAIVPSQPDFGYDDNVQLDLLHFLRYLGDKQKIASPDGDDGTASSHRKLARQIVETIVPFLRSIVAPDMLEEAEDIIADLTSHGADTPVLGGNAALLGEASDLRRTPARIPLQNRTVAPESRKQVPGPGRGVEEDRLSPLNLPNPRRVKITTPANNTIPEVPPRPRDRHGVHRPSRLGQISSSEPSSGVLFSKADRGEGLEKSASQRRK